MSGMFCRLFVAVGLEIVRKGRGILLLTQLYPPTKGGTPTWFSQVYSRLESNEVHVLTDEVDGAAAFDRQQNNSIYRLTANRYSWLRPESLIIYVMYVVKGLMVIWRNPIAVVHAGRVLPEGLSGLVIARLTGRRLIVYAHGEEITTWTQRVKYWAMKKTYQLADKVIVNSCFTENELIKLGVKQDNIVHIEPGVNIEHFKPGLRCEYLKEQLNIPPEAKIILSVGRYTRRKGFDHLIESVRRMLDEGLDAHYVCIGKGEDRLYLQRLAQQQGVEDRVHLLSNIETEDLPLWYNVCDVFAMPNREINGDTEGFGIVFLEAAACGKPVIAGKAGGAESAVVHEKNGIQVDGDSLDEIVSALSKILRNPSLAAAMGNYGHQWVNQYYSWERVVAQTKALVD